MHKEWLPAGVNNSANVCYFTVRYIPYFIMFHLFSLFSALFVCLYNVYICKIYHNHVATNILSSLGFGYLCRSLTKHTKILERGVKKTYHDRTPAEMLVHLINTHRPEQNGWHFANNFICILTLCIFITISLIFFPKDSVDRKSALVQV